MSNYAELITIIYPIVFEAEDYVDDVKEETEVLGLSIKEEEILTLGSVIKETSNLADALTLVGTITPEEIEPRVNAERNRLKDLKREREAADASLVAKELEAKRVVEQQTKLAKMIGAEVQKAISKVERQDSYTTFEDYKIESVMGYYDSDGFEKDLEKIVQKKLRNGWIPIGGVHVSYAQDTGAMLFSQAIGKPRKS